MRAILGQSAAMVTGIGEVIEPIDNIPPFDCVVVFPDGQCPTPAVYRTFDELNLAASIPATRTHDWTTSPRIPRPHNDLLDAAKAVCPSIADAMQAIEGLGLEPRLTGSGSALFVIVESKDQAIAIADAIRKTGIAACDSRSMALS